MKMLPIIALLAALLLTSACVAPTGAPVAGWLITSDVKGPAGIGCADVQCTKTGVSTAQGIVFFASGDASIQAAMAAGGITKVHHVDSKVFSVIGLYVKYETTVYGE